LIGTHTSNDEQNYLQIIKVKIPLESSKDVRDFNDNAKDTSGLGNPNSSSKKERIQIESQFNHAGEVNRARSMP
jgi:hypothetical protein